MANHLQFHKPANHSVSVMCQLTKVTFQIKQLNFAFKLWQILNSWCHLCHMVFIVWTLNI